MAKPSVAVMLGIGGKPRSGGSPPFGGPKASPPVTQDPMEGMENEGTCSVMCPKCGEMMNLTVQPQAAEESAETGMGTQDQMAS